MFLSIFQSLFKSEEKKHLVPKAFQILIHIIISMCICWTNVADKINHVISPVLFVWNFITQKSMIKKFSKDFVSLLEICITWFLTTLVIPVTWIRGVHYNTIFYFITDRDFNKTRWELNTLVTHPFCRIFARHTKDSWLFSGKTITKLGNFCQIFVLHILDHLGLMMIKMLWYSGNLRELVALNVFCL